MKFPSPRRHLAQLFQTRFLLGWVLIWLGILGAVFSLRPRLQREMRPTPVEIAVEWSDISLCASAWGVTTSELLKQLRREGTRGALCEVATISGLADDGRLLLLPRPTAEIYFPAARAAPKSATYVILCRDTRLFAQIENWIAFHPNRKPFLFDPGNQQQKNVSALTKNLSSTGPLQAMAISVSTPSLWSWPVGFDVEQIETLREVGLEPIVKLENFDGFSPGLIEELVKESRRIGARIWLPGTQVPGYKSLLPMMSMLMRRHHLALAYAEDSGSLGVNDFASDAQGWVVRTHGVGVLDTARLQRDELIDRYARAVRERNVRLLIVRLPRQLHGSEPEDGKKGVSARQQSLTFMAGLNQEITETPWPWRSLRPALTIGLARPVGTYATSRLKAIAARACGGLPLVGAVLLLVELFSNITPRLRIGLSLVGLGMVLGLAVSAGMGAKLLALGNATIFAVVALAWSGLDKLNKQGQNKHRFRREGILAALGVLWRASGIAFLGGLAVAAVLNDWTFHVKVAEFLGTKIASVFPLVPITLILIGDFWPEQVQREGAISRWQRFQQRLIYRGQQAFPLGSILITLACGIVVALWLARSGNDSGVAVTSLEWRFRALLETLFIARPRTKEFLLCHPALVLGALAWFCQRKPLAFWLLMLGMIGQVNIINSFAQANNPLYLPFWRTVLSLILGSGFGILLGWPLALLWKLRRDETAWLLWKPLLRVAAASAAIAFCCMVAIRINRNRLYATLTAPTPEATWPWKAAHHEVIVPGVEHWLDTSSPDGTTLDLISFDFVSNPRLRFGLYDCDLASPQKGSPPNRFAYWDNGVGKVGQRLNAKGDLIAAWNGSFWGLLNLKPREADRAFHLSPIIHQGKVYYPGVNYRWTWGAKMKAGQPQFALEHLPNPQVLEQRFDESTGTLQALIKQGQPLKTSAYPWFGAAQTSMGQASTPNEAGTIPVLDQMHTSRIGVGWTDKGRLFVLIVKEPDGEAPSRAAVNQWQRGNGGWTLHDQQNFWLAMQKTFGVQNAVGLDGGDVAQAILRRPNGDYTLLVPRLALPETQKATLRLQSNPRFDATDVQALHGGALNYFTIRQVAK